MNIQAPHFRFFLALCSVFCMLSSAGNLSASEAFAVEIALHENTTDGCTACGCQLKGVLKAGEVRHWWMTYAEVEPASKGVWTRLGPEALSYCGEGEFKSLGKNFLQTKGTPYIIVQALLRADGDKGGSARLKVEWSVASLDGFTRRGKASYQQLKSAHEDVIMDSLESVIPVLFANDREREEFGIYELFASLRVNQLSDAVTQYGTIEVGGDIPGAWILLDGSLVGRIVEDQTTAIGPIPVGSHSITVHDFSDRKAEQAVQLNSNQTVSVQLNLLDTVAEQASDGLVSAGANPQGLEEYWRAKDGVLMVTIPEGDFLMGSDSPQSEPDERPEHMVYLDGFLIDKTEVTWRQYRKFANATGATLPPEPLWGRRDDYALSNTTWAEGQAYCSWVGGRLPTEAEWEKAARGTDGRDYPWGPKWDPTFCNSISGGLHQPEPVGSFPACISPYGVLDMIGSHWQWVSDYYDENYYQVSPQKNPTGPEQTSVRVRRGGYWMSHAQQLPVTRRGKAAADWRNTPHGFRCARALPEKQS